LGLYMAMMRAGTAGSILEASSSLDEEDDMMQLLPWCWSRMKMINLERDHKHDWRVLPQILTNLGAVRS
jgi:hypothetical protein